MEARIHELEQDMPHLYLRHTTVFALASAWAERYDPPPPTRIPLHRARTREAALRLSRGPHRPQPIPTVPRAPFFVAFGSRQKPRQNPPKNPQESAKPTAQ